MYLVFTRANNLSKILKSTKSGGIRGGLWTANQRRAPRTRIPRGHYSAARRETRRKRVSLFISDHHVSDSYLIFMPVFGFPGKQIEPCGLGLPDLCFNTVQEPLL